MTKPLFPKSLRKHIRQEKARIRREVVDEAIRQELIEKMCRGFLPKQKEEAKAPKVKKVAVKNPELAGATKEQ